MNRRIICENEDGIRLSFGKEFAPFVLENCEGIYCVQNNVITSENTMTNGATYQGSSIRMRNIVLTLRDGSESEHRNNRELIYTLFKHNSPGVLTYDEGDGSENRSIRYYVENIDIQSTGKARKAVISLLCPDPFFEGSDDVTVTIAGWEKGFEFIHQFRDGGEELGSRGKEMLSNIKNNSAAENIGMSICITANGPVTNPTIHHVELQESITVGNDRKPLYLYYGDQLIITTGNNDKNVYLVKNGKKTNINEYLTEESEFIQLMHGDNTIAYSALAGDNYMTIDISYRYKYLGV